MRLSAAQTATFKTWLTNNAAGLDDQSAANLANAAAAPSYFIWQTRADKAVIDAQITKSNYTPSDAVPASPSTDMTYQNRALLCQLKQTNAQWLTGGSGPGSGNINAQLTSVRQNFQDCMTGIPSGASGANTNAGWGTPAAPGAVRLAMMRLASNFEKLYVTAASGPGNAGGDARGANTNPDLLGVDADSASIDGALVTAQLVAETRG